MGYALQMSWQPSLLHQKRKSGPPLGLKNLGNTCYLNSVLQCLTYTPPLANFCLRFLHSSSCDTAKGSTAEKKTECPFCIIERRIARSLSIEASLDSPVKINNCLKVFAEHFRHGRQEDAHEFLRYVIDACHNTCLRIKKLQQRRKGGSVENGGSGNGHTVVKEIFGGALQSQIKCLSCGAESNKVDEIMDISLDILHSGSLKEALQRFFQPEVLDGNNKYKCENCKKLVVARKQMSILQAPNVLVIQLKRFEGIFGGKVDKPIAFEEVLVLSSYMCKASQDLHPDYNLFGTIVHSGFSADSGHYYAYIKDAMGRWYCCNDSFVSVATLQEVLSEKVYILFFSRSKQRQVPSKTSFVANGKKSHESNGSLSSRIPRSGSLEKPIATKQFSDHHSQVVNSTTSKANKVPSSPSKKLSVFESSNNKRPPAAGNIRILVQKKESLEKNGHLVNREGKEKTTKSLIDRNGVSKSESADAIDDRRNKSFPLSNGNDKNHNTIIDTSVDHLRDIEERSRISSASASEKEMVTGSLRGSSENSGSKRKSQDEDRCILLAKDAKSRAKVDEFKEIIGKEAASFLKSCGWSDKVYTFMTSRKKLCTERAGNDASNCHELKRSLIADAKSNFIPQIPESLKGSLIGRLRSFSQETQSTT